MVPWSRQHFWFWVASACLVWSAITLQPSSLPVVENSVNTDAKYEKAKVYRSRNDLPLPEIAVSTGKEDFPVESSHSTPTAVQPPLLAPPVVFEELKAVEQELLTIGFQEPASLESTHQPELLLPNSVWLSGQIELNDGL